MYLSSLEGKGVPPPMGVSSLAVTVCEGLLGSFFQLPVPSWLDALPNLASSLWNLVTGSSLDSKVQWSHWCYQVWCKTVSTANYGAVPFALLLFSALGFFPLILTLFASLLLPRRCIMIHESILPLRDPLPQTLQSLPWGKVEDQAVFWKWRLYSTIKISNMSSVPYT